MKNFSIWLVVLILTLSLAACQSTSEVQTDDSTEANADTAETTDTIANVDTAETTNTATPEDTSPEYPDTWLDFSSATPILDDSGDADISDIKRVYAANDDDYIYVAFEVDTDHIDSTTMINGGTCVFIGIDEPGYFLVNDIDNNILADIDGNGDYFSQATYRYEDGILQIRVPLSVFGNATEYTINTLMRAKKGDEKYDADTIDDFVYTRDS